jgi:hypothetical protein
VTEQPEPVETVEAPRLTPTERIYNLGMAALTKPPRTSTQTESVQLKQVATGDLKGRWICDEVTVPRHEGETLDGWLERVRLVVVQVDTEVIRLNAANLRLAREAAVVEGRT